MLRDWPLPAVDGDKDSTGRVLIAAGSVQTPGALLLAAHGCLRAGAGKLQLATVQALAASVAVAMPEALVLGVPQTPAGDLDPAAHAVLSDLAVKCSGVLLGAGVLEPASAVALLGGRAARRSRCSAVSCRPWRTARRRCCSTPVPSAW